MPFISKAHYCKADQRLCLSSAKLIIAKLIRGIAFTYGEAYDEEGKQANYRKKN
jgi:hypothetical protein